MTVAYHEVVDSPRNDASAILALNSGENLRGLAMGMPPDHQHISTLPAPVFGAQYMGLSRRGRDGSKAGLGRDEYRVDGLARRLGIKRDTVRRWAKMKWVSVRRDENNHRVIWADAEELKRLRALHNLPRTWANKTRLADLKRSR